MTSQHNSAYDQAIDFWRQYGSPEDLWLVRFIQTNYENLHSSTIKLFIGSKEEAISQAKEYARRLSQRVVGICRIDKYEAWNPHVWEEVKELN